MLSIRHLRMWERVNSKIESATVCWSRALRSCCEEVSSTYLMQGWMSMSGSATLVQNVAMLCRRHQEQATARQVRGESHMACVMQPCPRDLRTSSHLCMFFLGNSSRRHGTTICSIAWLEERLTPHVEAAHASWSS